MVDKKKFIETAEGIMKSLGLVFGDIGTNLFKYRLAEGLRTFEIQMGYIGSCRY